MLLLEIRDKKVARYNNISASFQNEDKIGLQFYWSKFGTGSGFGIRDSGFGPLWITGFLWINYLLTIFSSLAIADNDRNTRNPCFLSYRIPNPEFLKNS